MHRPFQPELPKNLPIGQIRWNEHSSPTVLDRMEFCLACLVTFFAPMNFLRLDIAYFTLADFFAFVFCLVVVANKSLPTVRIGAASALWLVGVALLVGFLLLSTLVNGDVTRGLIVTGQYLQAFLVFPLIFVTRSREQLIVMGKLFVFSIFLMCLHGIYLIHIDGQTNTRFVSGNGRLRSFVERSNEAAALIAMTLPLLLFLRDVGRLRSISVLLIATCYLYGVILTGSNSGLLAFFFGLGLYSLISLNWKLIIAGCIAVFGFVFLIQISDGAFLPEVFQKRVLGALTTGELDQAGTYTHRLDLIKEASAMADGTFLIGIGANQYQEASQFHQAVHNAYLLIWTEGGILAMMGFLTIIASSVIVVVRLIKMDGSTSIIVCSLSIIILFAALINSTPHVYARFWVVPMLLSVGLAWTFHRTYLMTRFLDQPRSRHSSF